MEQHSDVLIIGAGPSGSVAAANILAQGYSVTIIEREIFPRFSIGESLLPQSMTFLEEAGMLGVIEDAGFQYKNGAAFQMGLESTVFNFAEKFTGGPSSTFQVQRDNFDYLLANEAQRQGASIHYGQTIEKLVIHDSSVEITARESTGESVVYRGKFLFDASGFGRVVPRLLDLETPSSFPVRNAIFTHIRDEISSSEFDRDKILISVHPRFQEVWYWLIPFSDGRASLGVVAPEKHLPTGGADPEKDLRTLVEDAPNLRSLLSDSDYDSPIRVIRGYSANVTSLVGNRYALLGNAGEFLDPIFSSGVTIALKSASLASKCLGRELSGEPVDWVAEYEQPLRRGIDVFRAYVDAWYDGRFRDIVFYPNPDEDIKAMVCSVLAGYAWDENNPYTQQLGRRLNTLAQICARD